MRSLDWLIYLIVGQGDMSPEINFLREYRTCCCRIETKCGPPDSERTVINLQTSRDPVAGWFNGFAVCSLVLAAYIG